MTPPPPIKSSRRDEFADGPRVAVATVVRRGEENKVLGCLKEVVWATKSRRGGHQRVHRRQRSQTGAGRRRPTIGGGLTRHHAPPLRVGVRQAADQVHPAFGAPCCIGSHLAGALVLLCTAPHWISSRGCTLVAVHLPALDRWRLGPALTGVDRALTGR
ncbi:hypothetical protein GQ457_08G008450 [Hibiscus cannabinus]